MTPTAPLGPPPARMATRQPAPRMHRPATPQEVRRAYREVLLTCQRGASVSGVILFKETLHQATAAGKPFVQCLQEQGIMPGIKVDEVRRTAWACSRSDRIRPSGSQAVVNLERRSS